VIATTGPAHQPRFTIEVRLQGFEPERGEGGSKREAEKIAADLMLRKREDAL
jgi:ribonuclease-3